MLGVMGVESLFLRALPVTSSEAHGGRKKYPRGPVLGGQYGACFDICVLREQGLYRMWVSWRPKKSVAVTESKDGIHWDAPEIVLPPEPSTGWEDDMNRPVIVHREDGYHMWYTGQANGKSKIGYAKSTNGREWDSKESKWKMWYSGGEQYEPNAIGYATSRDGLRWDKHPSNPVLVPSPGTDWEKERVTAAQIIFSKGWYDAFYIGFREVDHAQIGLARSKDGITGWVRHPANPIVRPTPGGWDADACYKPYAVYANGRWMLWYNGRNKSFEQIGLVTHSGEDLGFRAL
jgi:beta-1,2-mannobiose phosphorylase / 1,2-beta-oligomannan phosphorylase